MRAFQSAKAQIEKKVLEWCEMGESDDRLIAHVERLSHPSGEQQIVGADDLWSVTSTAVGLQGLVELICDRVHSLEKATGREWYGRG